MKRLVAIFAIFFAICIIIFAVGIGMWDQSIEGNTNRYDGKVLLESPEYEDLKMLLAREDVDVSRLDVYSSDPHLVQFTAYVPGDIEFGYGEVVLVSWHHAWWWDAALWAIAPLVLAIIILAATYTPSEEKQK